MINEVRLKSVDNRINILNGWIKSYRTREDRDFVIRDIRGIRKAVPPLIRELRKLMKSPVEEEPNEQRACPSVIPIEDWDQLDELCKGW